jgi:hypothetical protein
MSHSHEISWHEDNNVTSVTNPNDSCTGFSRAIHHSTLRVWGALSTRARRSGREAHDLNPSSIETKNAQIVQLGITAKHSGDTRFDLNCLERDITSLYTLLLTNSFIKYGEYEPLIAIHWNKACVPHSRQTETAVNDALPAPMQDGLWSDQSYWSNKLRAQYYL